MWFLWKTANKNLFRHRTRSLVSILAIAITIGAITFSRGFVQGIADNLFQHHIHLHAGHIRITHKEYHRKECLLPLEYRIDGFRDEGVEEMISELLTIPGVQRAIKRIHFYALYSSSEKMVTMRGWGIQPEEEMDSISFHDYIIEGIMVREGFKEMVLGVRLLEELGFQVGDTITILYWDSFGALKGTSFTIVGTMKSHLPLIDTHSFFIPLDQAQEILDMPASVTQILLLTEHRLKSREVLPLVEEVFLREGAREYLPVPWEESDTTIAYLIVGEKIYSLIYLFILLLACVVLANTMLMIIKERTQEIGMMTAMGLKKREILSLFLMESIAMGTIGSFIGVIVGGLTTYILSSTGVDYSHLFGEIESEILISPILYPIFSWQNLLLTFTLGVVVTALTSIVSVRRAALLEPVEALRRP